MKKIIPVLAFLGGAAGLAFVACGGSSGGGGTPSTDAGNDGTMMGTCTPGQQVSCACPGSSVTGAQSCLANGSGYGACTGCPGAGDGSTVADSGPDGGHADGSTSGDSGPDGGPGHASVFLVNASPDFGPMRFCFAGSTDGVNFTVMSLPALPDTVIISQGTPVAPGLYQGNGGALPDLGDLSKVILRSYAIKSASIAAQAADAGGAEEACGALVGASSSLTAGTDYFQLADLPAGSFALGTTEAVAVVGCLPASQDQTSIMTSTARCGSDYDATNGNIEAKVFTLDTTTPQTATTFGAQTLHASSALDGLLAMIAGTPVVEDSLLVNTAADGGPAGVGTIANGQVYGTLAPDSAAPQAGSVLALPGIAYGVMTIGGTGGADGGPSVVNQLALPLSFIATLTGTDAGWTPGDNYTFVLLGDPEAQQLFTGGMANPAYNGFGIHVIAFPNRVGPPKIK
jgi:hypothetical protein